MRKLFPVMLGLVLALVTANLFAQAKIAVIDPQKIMKESREGKRTQGQLKVFFDQKQGELTAREAELKALEEKIKDPKYAEDKKEELRAQFNQKFYESQAFAKAAQEEMESREQKALAELQDKMLGIVSKYASAKGFSVVLVKQACVYSADTLEITTDVIAEMDKAFPGS